jgi:hypothetical protein
MDASRTQPVANTRRDLFEAMKQIAETGHGPEEQIAVDGMFDQVERLRILK